MILFLNLVVFDDCRIEWRNVLQYLLIWTSVYYYYMPFREGISFSEYIAHLFWVNFSTFVHYFGCSSFPTNRTFVFSVRYCNPSRGVELPFWFPPCSDILISDLNSDVYLPVIVESSWCMYRPLVRYPASDPIGI